LPVPAEQPEISIKQLLFLNWQITTPGVDSVAETFVPGKVCFTTRYYATNPMRIHNYQISVLAGDTRRFSEEVGSIVMYRVEEQLAIHIWAIAGIGDDWETVENNLRAMLSHTDDIIRIGSVIVPGVQFVRNAPGWRQMDDRERRLVLHRVSEITAIYYETATALPITPPIAPYLIADIGAADQSSSGPG
jgi:hypothetical protein